MSTWRDYFENILIAVVLALVVRTFVFTGYKVPTSSMAPTLLPGDFIFAYRLPFGIKVPLTEKKFFVASPERGEVVVFTYKDQPKVNYVKRVIGVSGDRIQIENGELSVNGQKLIYESLPSDLSQQVLQELPNPDFFKAVTERAVEGARVLLFQQQRKRASFGPIVVPPNEVFLLGDNRDASDDSRYWGTVPIERIEGQVMFIWLSLNWQKKIWDNRIPTVRWDRTGTSLR